MSLGGDPLELSLDLLLIEQLDAGIIDRLFCRFAHFRMPFFELVEKGAQIGFVVGLVDDADGLVKAGVQLRVGVALEL